MHALIGRTSRWLGALAFLLVGMPALPGADQAKGSTKTCVLDGQNIMAFGTYDTMSNTPLDMQGRVSYRCYTDHPASDAGAQANTQGGGKLTVMISLSAGNAGGFNRYMNGAADRLNYNLYMDPQRQTVWGDGTGGSRVYMEHAQPNNHVVQVPVYGRIFGAQDVGASTYTDSLIVTLDF